MRRKLMITLLTMTMIASLFVGCGTSETVETPVEEETVVEETVEDPEVVESEEENTTVETEETNESEETAESETVAKPKASTHYKEWKEKQEEEVAEPEVAENTKKETEKKEDTTTTASTTTTNTNTNNNTSTPTPTPEPTPSNDNTTTPVAETPSAPAAPATPSNNGEHVHNWVRTVVNQVTYTKSVGTGQYEQVVVGYSGGEPIWGEYGDLIGATPQEPIYETREIMTTQVVTEDVYANVCSTCGAVQ